VIPLRNGADGVIFKNLAGRGFPLARPLTPAEISEADPDVWHRRVLDGALFDVDHMDENLVRQCLRAAVLWMLFDLEPTERPILTFYGPPGSGKTTIARSIVRLLMESHEVDMVPRDERGAIATLTNCRQVVWDNVDKKVDDWFENIIAQVATGATFSIAELYKTNSLVNRPCRSSMILTAFSPPFRRPDVASRLMVVKLKRREQPLFEDVNVSEEERPGLVASLLADARRFLQATTFPMKPFPSAFRFPRYSAFVAALYGESPAREILTALADTGEEFATEDDFLIELLYDYANDPEGKLFSMGEALRGGELFKRLKDYAESKKTEFFFRSAATMGRALREKEQAIRKRIRFRVEWDTHSKTQRYWLAPGEPVEKGAGDAADVPPQRPAGAPAEQGSDGEVGF